MNIFKIVLLVVVICNVISLIYRHLITARNYKPSKVSKLFYRDDESFKKSWKKIKEKGILKHVIKGTIIMTAMMGVIGLFFLFNNLNLYGEAQSQTVYYALLMGIVLGVLTSLMQWYFENDRYDLLKEKAKVESEN
ncbi:MAG: hypothetical protein ACREVX_02315 [Clostridium sp.]|uniref:hypothetical protein n=1 Tax=Clostridium sp. TaxID=1506 RepID=UPI003D6DA52A